MVDPPSKPIDAPAAGQKYIQNPVWIENTQFTTSPNPAPKAVMPAPMAIWTINGRGRFVLCKVV
jgi:hypothetical protein